MCASFFFCQDIAILKYLGLLPGPKHNGDLGTNLSEYPIHIFFQGEYVPRHRPKRRVSHWTCRVLVQTPLLEVRSKMVRLLNLKQKKRTCSLIGSVHCNKHRGRNASFNDRYLDGPAWWVTHLLVSGQGLDITPVYRNRYHNRWVLGPQPRVRTLPGGVLFILSNGNGRPIPTWVRLHGACSPQIAIAHTTSDLGGLPWGVQVFGMFGLTNRASSIVGPNVIQSLINRTGNT